MYAARALPPLRHRSRLAALAVAALVLTGCSDADSPKADPPSSASNSSSASSASGKGVATPSAQAATVTLIDAGAAPRRTATLDVEEGHTETSTVDLVTTTSIDFMSSGPITLPMRIPFTSTVSDVSDDEVGVDIRYGKATIADDSTLQKALVEQARTALGYLDGATAHVVQGPSGAVLSSEVDLGDDAPDLVGRILEDLAAQGFALTVPFPTEPVGVGARWRVESDLSIGGSGASLESTYELTGLTDQGYRVAVTATQTAVPGDTLAGKVIDGSSTSTGTVRGRTGLVGPLRATSTGAGETTVEVGGQRVTTTFEIELAARTS